jgi:hypothetical protein
VADQGNPGPPPAPPPRAPGPPIATHGWPTPGQADGGRLFRRAVQVASVIPAAFALFLLIVAPAFLDPLFTGHAGIPALPPIVLYVALLAGLAAANMLALRLVRSEVAVGILVAVTTTIGLFIVILGPAIVIIADNLAT